MTHLPDPDWPTSARMVPAETWMLKFSKMLTWGRAG